MKKDLSGEITDNAIMGLALNCGFMISTQCGKGKAQRMPVTDPETIIRFARELIKLECVGE